jgi:hypothetical protein
MIKKTAALTFGFFFLSAAAQAYSPPASFILGQLLKGREKIKTIDLEGRFSSPATGGMIKESLRIDFPTGKVLAIYTSESGESLGAKVTKIQDLHALGRAWIGLGMDPFGNRMRVTLEDLGVYPQETQEVKIDRIGSHVVWVWGDENHLKVLKDEFLFAGYQDADHELDVRDFTAKTGSLRLPKTVYIKNGDYTYELKAFRLNATTKTPPSLTPIQSPAVREWVELVR